jgi:multiple sugar transport system permease protein
MPTTRRLSSVVLDLGTYLVLAPFVLFSTLPLAWLLLTSLKPEEDIVTRSIRYLPARITFEHYAAIWRQSEYPTLLINSLVTTTLTVGICLGVGITAAYAFSRLDFPGRTKLLLGYLVVRMFPAVLVMIPLFVLLRDVGLLDTCPGLALAYASFLLPLFVWIMKGFFDAVPPNIEDAARIDGCTRFDAMVRITLPLVRRGLLGTTVFVAISSWNEFFFALMLTTSFGSRTWPVGLQLMVGEFQLPWGMLAAGGVISVLPVIVLYALVQRTMFGGLGADPTQD